MNDTPTVISAALRTKDVIFSKPRPARHHDIICALHAMELSTAFIAACEQGFVLSDGYFANRKQAAACVEMAEQPTRSAVGVELFSEDLW